MPEHEAEGLGYVCGNNGEPCDPSIFEIRNSIVLMGAFFQGWKEGTEDRAQGIRRIEGDGKP